MELFLNLIKSYKEHVCQEDWVFILEAKKVLLASKGFDLVKVKILD